MVNFPAEQCRAMGADYIIGVSMSPGLEDNPDKLSSILSQVKQLKEIITDKDRGKYHEQCDIFISPDLNGVTTLSFNAESVAKVTKSGYEAALAQAKNFEALKEKVLGGAELHRSNVPGQEFHSHSEFHLQYLPYNRLSHRLLHRLHSYRQA